ncbi:PAQR family membrane homeostasis protein TrhA [Ideonella sp. BN130291]|uniref:PAQR family membrane homeostasis protein TrhA n=1 Tax=Ideonella sp. BN130291 TaxID=3112940 RepID=UPI002E255CDC|nr:hemolysin III family protein [Ideonella sp. BN130291]
MITEQRPQTLGEEIANSISHGIGFLLAVASLPILLRTCAERGGQALDLMAVSVFAGTMMLLYLVSAVYHALPVGRIKEVFNRFDHAAIYLFIAGSYTPFALGALRGGLGWTLFGVVWVLAAMGALAKLLNRLSHPLWSTGLYIAMGWLAVFAAGPLLERVSPQGLTLLLAGGVSYTLGAVVFLFDSRIRYAHFVWHLFVLAGSTCHFFAALWYAR